MKKLLILVPAIIMVLMLGFTTGCDDDDDDKIMGMDPMVMMLLLDQMGGNCAIITKTSETLFGANGNLLPKGGCVDLSVYTIDKSKAKQWSDEVHNAVIAEFNKRSDCSDQVAGIETARDAVTADGLETAADAQPDDCSTGPGLKRLIAPGVYCITQTAMDAYKTNLTDTTKFHVVGNIMSDMSTSYAVTIDTAYSMQGLTGFSDAQIAAGKVFGAFEYAVMFSDKYAAYGAATGDCKTAVVAANADLKNFIIRSNGNGASAVGITTSDTEAAVNVLISFGLNCGYGISFVPSATLGTCPYSYPTW